jgi:SAM-dependent methyltransferase
MTTDPSHGDAVRSSVRTRYARIAQQGGSCCTPKSACTSDPLGNASVSAGVGYSAEEMGAVPDGSNLGLGCGNPQAIAALKPGETVLDLGSGGGFDCFLAARQVGETGLVIGVDMTPEMLSRARGNAVKGGYTNVEFRLGEIEHLPVADGTVDVVISNCVINLSPDKPQVYREAFRVLRNGGRVAVSDVVAVKPLPAAVKASLDAHCGCVAGAGLVPDLERMLHETGFVDVRIRVNRESREFIKTWFPGSGVEEYVVSADIEARKGTVATPATPAARAEANCAPVSPPSRGSPCCGKRAQTRRTSCCGR